MRTDLSYALMVGAGVIPVFLLIVYLFLHETGKRGSRVCFAASVILELADEILILCTGNWDILSAVGTGIYILFLPAVLFLQKTHD